MFYRELNEIMISLHETAAKNNTAIKTFKYNRPNNTKIIIIFIYVISYIKENKCNHHPHRCCIWRR